MVMSESYSSSESNPNRMEALKKSSIIRNILQNIDEVERKYAAAGPSTSEGNTNFSASVDVASPKKKRSRKKKKSPNKAIEADVAFKNNSQQEVTSVVESIPSTSILSQLLHKMEITAVRSHVHGQVLQIKKPPSKYINIKYFNGDLADCNCNCHTRIENVKVLRDNTKFATNTPSNVFNGTIKLSDELPHNNMNLQYDSIKNTQQNVSTAATAKKKKHKGFPQYTMNKAEIRHKLNTGQLFKGIIRINVKNFREAYVTNNNEDGNDYMLQSVKDRNRALEGDIVAVQLKPEDEWTDRLKTCSVAGILEKVHPRSAVGFLQPMQPPQFAAFIPRDVRVPKLRIPIKLCPQGFQKHPNRYENVLYKAKIKGWSFPNFADGELLESLGVSGDLDSETSAILADCCLDVTPFEPDVWESLNISDTIPVGEFAYRQDLRTDCIFTIDPATARDLDDAVSCKELDNGNLEIGVHISDVAFYLNDNSPLDKIVRKKATTVYMVNSVYHMLPVELCLHCSLLPGKDKLAFSVFWEMTKSGEIISHRFSRTILNSCVQLSYEHAQSFIEKPNHIFEENCFPQIYGGYTQRDLSKTINYLQTIATNLRKNRFDNGALRIDQIKLLFHLDERTGEPTEFFVYENKEAHRLIEEFMLLANITVATELVHKYPDIAFVRCHEPPKKHMLLEVKRTLERVGIDLDISSSKALQSSVLKFPKGHCEIAVLNHLLAKPMVRAQYVCYGGFEIQDFSHYALSVPIYTHFTSPIRRYADIMVHRLLAASLNYTEAPNWNSSYVTDIANNCNKQKYNAKCAGEASSNLFLTCYIAHHQPFIQKAVVIDIKQTSFDILVYATGTVVKIFMNKIGEDIECECQVSEEDKKTLVVVFKESSELPVLKYEIVLFAVVTVALHRKPKTYKLEATLVRPQTTQMKQLDAVVNHA